MKIRSLPIARSGLSLQHNPRGWRRWLWLGILGWALLLLGCRSPDPVGLSAQITRVVSGQTVEILDPTGHSALTEQVRLLGVDTPDLDQVPWGSDAHAYLTQQLMGQSVRLESDVEERDRFGRRLAYVWLDGTLVNEQLLTQGYGLAAPRSPNLKYEHRFAHAQAKARALGLGIWNPDNPLRETPTAFRQHRSASGT